MRRSLIILALSVSFVIGDLSLALAARPLYTADSGITTLGKPQIEIGGLLLTRRDNTGVRELITSLKYGIAKDLDVSLDIPYMTHTSAIGNYDGLADGQVKVKYRFFADSEHSAAFMLGYQTETTDPNNPGNSNPYANELTTMAIYTGNIYDMEYSLNFAYTFDNELGGKPSNDFIVYNASLSRNIVTDKLNLVGETQYSRNTYTWEIVHEIATGLNYKLNDTIILDTAIGCGLTEDSSSSNFVMGATILFN